MINSAQISGTQEGPNNGTLSSIDPEFGFINWFFSNDMKTRQQVYNGKIVESMPNMYKGNLLKVSNWWTYARIVIISILFVLFSTVFYLNISPKVLHEYISIPVAMLGFSYLYDKICCCMAFFIVLLNQFTTPIILAALWNTSGVSQLYLLLGVILVRIFWFIFNYKAYRIQREIYSCFYDFKAPTGFSFLISLLAMSVFQLRNYPILYIISLFLLICMVFDIGNLIFVLSSIDVLLKDIEKEQFTMNTNPTNENLLITNFSVFNFYDYVSNINSPFKCLRNELIENRIADFDPMSCAYTNIFHLPIEKANERLKNLKQQTRGDLLIKHCNFFSFCFYDIYLFCMVGLFCLNQYHYVYEFTLQKYSSIMMSMVIFVICRSYFRYRQQEGAYHALVAMYVENPSLVEKLYEKAYLIFQKILVEEIQKIENAGV